jgi:hypothetical protein
MSFFRKMFGKADTWDADVIAFLEASFVVDSESSRIMSGIVNAQNTNFRARSDLGTITITPAATGFFRLTNLAVFLYFLNRKNPDEGERLIKLIDHQAQKVDRDSGGVILPIISNLTSGEPIGFLKNRLQAPELFKNIPPENSAVVGYEFALRMCEGNRTLIEGMIGRCQRTHVLSGNAIATVGAARRCIDI